MKNSQFIKRKIAYENIIPLTSLLFIVLLNTTFLYKYLIRINNQAVLFSVIYGFMQFSLFYFLKFKLTVKITTIHINSILGIIIILQAILLYNINVQTLNIDRWSVITSFLDELMNGNFPYLAKSHLNNPPGPFPGYYILAFPFYLLGEIGLFSLFGILIFLFSLKIYKYDNTAIGIILIILSTSVFIWYELAVRSTIFVNMAFLILFFVLLSKTKLDTIKQFIFYGLIGGLLLSTRGVVLFILFIFYLFLYLKNKEWTHFVYISFFTILGFILIFVPFAVWNWELFLKFNPITLQASFIPHIYLLLYLIIATLIGLYSKNRDQMLGLTGILLFIIVGIPFIISVNKTSLYFAIVKNGFDISYFIFSTPFLYFSLLNYEKHIKLKNI